MTALCSLQKASVTLGGRHVVNNVSLTVEPASITVLLGPNGAGKTTLMRAALGLVPLSAGSARLGDDDPRILSVRARALRAAYLPQRPNAIWPVSVEDIVALGRFAYGAAPDRLSMQDQTVVDAALEACQLTVLRKRRMDEISGGEKARAHLARALAQHAPMLVLDEPTSGLDPAQVGGVASILRNYAQGGGVLFSTHDIGFAVSIADKFLLMREGAVVAQGGVEALTPQALEQAYGRKGRLERVGETTVALFD